MATDNNETTAWNGVLGGGNAAPAPEKCSVSKTEALVYSSIGTAVGFISGLLAGREDKPKR